MFLQNYMFHAAQAIHFAHTSPASLHTADEKSTAVNWAAIRYGSLELRAYARRYVHFALPCMVAGLWSRGLKKDRPTFELIQKKTSDAGMYLYKMCYMSNNNLSENTVAPKNVIEQCYIGQTITDQQAQAVMRLFGQIKVAPTFTRNIPFFDDGHGYNFFYDNTPYDASYNLLLSEVAERAKADPEHTVGLPNLDLLFNHDDYFVIDRFSNIPVQCLGPTMDGTIIKKIQLMMGPEYVRDIAETSIRDLNEHGLWTPTEFEQLILLGDSTISGVLKTAFSGVSAPMALYWSWIDKCSKPNAPQNKTEWIHKELCDRIAAGEVYNLALDDATLNWLLEHKIAEVSKASTRDCFVIPNYDRNKYMSRAASERTMSFKDWAWSAGHAHSFPKSTGYTLTGLAHPAYNRAWDGASSETESAPRDRAPDLRAISSYARLTKAKDDVKGALSSKATDFLSWATSTVAPQSKLIEAIDKVMGKEGNATVGVSTPTIQKPVEKGATTKAMNLGTPDKKPTAPKPEQTTTTAPKQDTTGKTVKTMDLS